MPYHHVSSGVVVPSEVTPLLAPFDMQLVELLVHSGDRVAAGQLLAKFESPALEQQRFDLVSQLDRSNARVRQAILKNDIAAEMEAKNQAAELRIQLDKVLSDLDRCELLAPRDGLIVSDELQQRIGETFAAGSTLYRFSPAGKLALQFSVSEDQAQLLSAQQRGIFEIPQTARLGYTIENIEPKPEPVDGQDIYLVTARLDDTNEPSRLRPGMEGSAKTNSGWRPIPWVALRQW
jgi:multidrug efflux pump subunit AcrA (membrane-fusion protein)